ncbi:hypothetical protein MHYP_G00278790 [Metynnis hypsauchen]
MAVPAEEDSFTLEPNTGSFWPLSVPRREDEELPPGLNGNARARTPTSSSHGPFTKTAFRAPIDDWSLRSSRKEGNNNGFYIKKTYLGNIQICKPGDATDH